jgi:hypothetical protein
VAKGEAVMRSRCLLAKQRECTVESEASQEPQNTLSILFSRTPLLTLRPRWSSANFEVSDCKETSAYYKTGGSRV